MKIAKQCDATALEMIKVLTEKADQQFKI